MYVYEKGVPLASIKHIHTMAKVRQLLFISASI